MFESVICFIDLMFSFGRCTFPAELEAPEPEWIEKCEYFKFFFLVCKYFIV